MDWLNGPAATRKLTQFGDRRAQACCAQQTLTVPPDVRGFATTEEPAPNTTSPDWCRLVGLTPPTPEDPAPDHTRREARMSDPNYVKIGST